MLLLPALALSSLFLLAPGLSENKSEKYWLYVGTYTNGSQSKGIYLFEMDSVTGKVKPLGLAGEAVNPSFLAIHPNRKFLYAVDEIAEFGRKPTGAVSAFAIDPQTGKLKLLNQQPSEGVGPCHLVVDRAGKNVLVANYGGGNGCVLPIGADGKLGAASSKYQHQGEVADKKRQGGPHAHSINLDAANHFAFVADLGLDQVFVYRFDAEHGTL